MKIAQVTPRLVNAGAHKTFVFVKVETDQDGLVVIYPGLFRRIH